MQQAAWPAPFLKDSIDSLQLGPLQGPIGMAQKAFDGKEAYRTIRPVIAGVEPTIYRDTKLPPDGQWSSPPEYCTVSAEVTHTASFQRAVIIRPLTKLLKV